MPNCIYCGNFFEQNNNFGRKKKYCSRKCCDRRKAGVELTSAELVNIYQCKQCGQKFYSERKKRICSKECEKEYWSIKNQRVKKARIN
jgi:hypothetical protein